MDLGIETLKEQTQAKSSGTYGGLSGTAGPGFQRCSIVPSTAAGVMSKPERAKVTLSSELGGPSSPWQKSFRRKAPTDSKGFTGVKSSLRALLPRAARSSRCSD